MPVNTGQPNAYNIGKDCQFVVTGPNGTILANFPITKGNAKQNTKEVESRPLNLPPVFAQIPDGWTLDFTFDRVGSELDNIFVNAEQDYWEGSGNLLSFSILQTILNANDGSTSQYEFQNLAIKLDDAGEFSSNAVVPMKVMGRCSRRVLAQ
jgi:hypothetical protein